MHMAAVARGALSARGVLSSHQRFLPCPDGIVASTVRFFSTRRAGGSRVILCLAPGGGGPRDGADWDGPHWDGRLVDEGMDTLRRRIRQVRAESDPDEYDNDDEQGSVDDYALLPDDWTELERRHHGSYVAGVREAGSILLALLERARPGLGAGVMALVLLGVPVTLLLVSAELIVRALDSIAAAVLNGRM